MNPHQEHLMHYLTEQADAHQAQQRALAGDDRQDEAAFEQIRANIYEVFRTVLSTAQRVCGSDDAAIRAFFVQRLIQIPQSWSTALEEAKAHHDTKQQHLQLVKLNVAQDIRREMALWKEERP